MELDDVKREAPSFDAGRDAEPTDEFDRREEELIVRGAEAERPMMGGGEGVDEAVAGLDVGLSHEEKKSSSSWAEVGVGGISIPSTKTLSGNLITQGRWATLKVRKERIHTLWHLP